MSQYTNVKKYESLCELLGGTAIWVRCLERHMGARHGKLGEAVWSGSWRMRRSLPQADSKNSPGSLERQLWQRQPRLFLFIRTYLYRAFALLVPFPSLPSMVLCYHPPWRLEGKGRSREILGGQDMLKEVITQHRHIHEKETEEK